MKDQEFNQNNIAIAYYRYSSSAQNETSIEQQRSAAHDYAKAHDLQIIKEYSDYAITGTTDERPQFQLMLSEVPKMKPAALILWKTDRLGRDRYINASAKQKIRKAGTRIHLVAEATPDENTPESAILDSLLDGMAEFYSKQLRQNVKRGLKFNAEQGLYNGVKMYGYTVDEKKHYIPNPMTAPIVQEIYRDYANGKPMQQIVNDLNGRGLRTIKDKPFTINSIRRILHNKAYTGVYHYGEVTLPDTMPVIIKQELYDKVQAVLAKNKQKGAKPENMTADGSPRFWLTGKLYCGECGTTMHGASGTSKTGAKHYYYRCKNLERHKCKKKPVKQDYIETLVIRVMTELLHDTEILTSLAVDAADYYQKYYADTGYLEGLKQQLKETEKKLNNLLRALEAGIFSETTQQRLAELEEQKKALNEAIETEEIKTRVTKENEHSIAAYFQKYLNADLSNPLTRDSVFDYLIDRIYLYDDRLEITGFFSEDKTTVTWDQLQDGKIGFVSFAPLST